MWSDSGEWRAISEVWVGSSVLVGAFEGHYTGKMRFPTSWYWMHLHLFWEKVHASCMFVGMYVYVCVCVHACLCVCVCVSAGIRASLVYSGALECDSSVPWCGRCLPSGLVLVQANTSAHTDRQTSTHKYGLVHIHASTYTSDTWPQSMP